MAGSGEAEIILSADLIYVMIFRGLVCPRIINDMKSTEMCGNEVADHEIYQNAWLWK
jgi:hypothetical protein